jgi:Ca2+-binding EF-hand superfamily protein
LGVFTSKDLFLRSKARNLAKYLNDLVTLDTISESHKETLSLRNDISIRDLFRFFDLSNKNSINLHDFQKVISYLEIYASTNDINLLFKRFDRDIDGRLK